MANPTLSHDALCQLAVSWLKRPHSRQGPGCQVAFTEARNGWKDGEIPDAIGFRSGVYDEASVLVEVKVSRADFLADRQKPHRVTPALGMGRYRYYLAPAGLIALTDLPEGWGLIEAQGKKSLSVKAGHVLRRYGDPDPWAFTDRNVEREIGILSRMLNRVGDVDQLHRSIKESRNTNQRLAKHNDELRKKLEDLRVANWELREALAKAQGEPTDQALGRILV